MAATKTHPPGADRGFPFLSSILLLMTRAKAHPQRLLASVILAGLRAKPLHRTSRQAQRIDRITPRIVYLFDLNMSFAPKIKWSQACNFLRQARVVPDRSRYSPRCRPCCSCRLFFVRYRNKLSLLQGLVSAESIYRVPGTW